jgi:CBS domain-containing protein
MWRHDRERPDDPPSPQLETNRLARDEYDRPRYGSPPDAHAAPRHDHGGWSYDAPLRENGRAAWNHRHQHQQPQQHSPTHSAQAQEEQHVGRPLDDVRAHEFMTRRVASVHPATSVERAARLMEECDCGALPVVGDNGVLVGMVTDRDIALRIVARGREARHAIVADCMTERVFACYAHESIAECMRQMARHQVRRMPIVDDRGRLVGILAQGDLARHVGRHPVPEERRALAHVIAVLSEPGRMRHR